MPKVRIIETAILPSVWGKGKPMVFITGETLDVKNGEETFIAEITEQSGTVNVIDNLGDVIYAAVNVPVILQYNVIDQESPVAHNVRKVKNNKEKMEEKPYSQEDDLPQV